MFLFTNSEGDSRSCVAGLSANQSTATFDSTAAFNYDPVGSPQLLPARTDFEPQVLAHGAFLMNAEDSGLAGCSLDMQYDAKVI